MPAQSQADRQIRFADHRGDDPVPFEIIPDAAELVEIAHALGISAIRKMRFTGAVAPDGQKDWALAAKIGATVVQPCVITGDPVTTRIDTGVARRYSDDLPDFEGVEEVEMPEDDTLDPLPEVLDLTAVMTEALAIELPLYPRAEGAELNQSTFSEPGVEPMSEAAARPFAGLASLKEKMEDKGES